MWDQDGQGLHGSQGSRREYVSCWSYGDLDRLRTSQEGSHVLCFPSPHHMCIKHTMSSVVHNASINALNLCFPLWIGLATSETWWNREGFWLCTLSDLSERWEPIVTQMNQLWIEWTTQSTTHGVKQTVFVCSSLVLKDSDSWLRTDSWLRCHQLWRRQLEALMHLVRLGRLLVFLAFPLPFGPVDFLPVDVLRLLASLGSNAVDLWIRSETFGWLSHLEVWSDPGLTKLPIS